MGVCSPFKKIQVRMSPPWMLNQTLIDLIQDPLRTRNSEEADQIGSSIVQLLQNVIFTSDTVGIIGTIIHSFLQMEQQISRRLSMS